MKEKAIITQKQADAIEHFRKNGLSNSGILDSHFYKHYESETYKTISDENIDTDRLVAALYVGYEVEQPKFKAGDKVFWVSQDGSIKEFCEIDRERTGEGEPCWWFTDGDWSTEKQLRHATPEEIYWLHELGRDKVGDFREGDVIITQEVSYRYSMDGEVDTIGPHTTQLWLDEGIIKGIYPVESFKPFKKESE